MTFDEPAFWYRERRSLAAHALRPAAAIYGAIASRRLRRQASYVSQLPVLCVGNFTAGGTGKTPLSICIAALVRDLGREPVFLSRGYGGSAAAPLLVDAHNATAGETGDEPLLLARAAPAVVARNRSEGARFIEASFARNAVIIMDDGLQNPGLAKTLTIAVVDVNRGIGNGFCIPAGPLRAPLVDQLARTDAIVLTGRANAAEAGRRAQELTQQRSCPVLRAEVAPAGDLKWLDGAKVVAFAGIANPDRFFSLLTRAGATIVHRAAFPDHHAFSEDDAAALLTQASSHGARLVTTEKDFVRLYGADGRRAGLRAQTLTVPITLQFSDDDQANLRALVARAIGT